MWILSHAIRIKLKHTDSDKHRRSREGFLQFDIKERKGSLSFSVPEKPDARLHNPILLTSRARSNNQSVYPRTHPTEKSQPVRFPRGKRLLYSQRCCRGCKRNNHSNTSHWTELSRHGCYLLLLNRMDVLDPKIKKKTKKTLRLI